MAKGDRLYRKSFNEVQLNGYNSEAYFLLDRSFKLGNYKAAYSLATWYLFGEYVKKDSVKAVEYLNFAKDGNIPEAWFDLAVCYEKGKGTEKNLQQAFYCYLRAAILGDQSAKYEVGRCYYYGIGVEKDTELSRIWIDYSEKYPTYL